MTPKYCARKVVAVAGASGGHLFPAMSFLEETKRQQPEAALWLVVPKRCACQDTVSQAGATVVPLDVEAVRIGFNRRAVRGLAKFLVSFVAAARFIAAVKPDVVVGFGSIVSVPLVAMAWLFRCRTVIHEQNVRGGAANRLLAYCADIIAVSFEESREHFSGNRSKVVVAGNPLRRQMQPLNREEARRRLGVRPDMFTLLVLGGSQGAHALNQVCVQACSRGGVREHVQVVHASGMQDEGMVSRQYAESGVTAQVKSFITDMAAAYSAADLCVSRAGAGAVTELAVFGVPSILVPYPYAQAHQEHNAGVLVSRGAAVLCRERDFTSQVLFDLIVSLREDPQRLEHMRAACARAVQTDAAARLVREVIFE